MAAATQAAAGVAAARVGAVARSGNLQGVRRVCGGLAGHWVLMLGDVRGGGWGGVPIQGLA
jgi:hypothetical protein